MFDIWESDGVDLAAVDEIVTITMHGACVVIRPTCELDGLRTRVFVDALNAAVLAGSIVVHAPFEADADAAVDAPFFADQRGDSGLDRTPADVAVVRAGVISVPVSDVLWTIDVRGGRFIRSDAAIDVRFLVEHDWTYYSTMWFTDTTVTAATTCGSYVMGHRPAVGRDVDHPSGRSLTDAIA